MNLSFLFGGTIGFVFGLVTFGLVNLLLGQRCCRKHQTLVPDMAWLSHYLRDTDTILEVTHSQPSKAFLMRTRGPGSRKTPWVEASSLTEALFDFRQERS